MALTSRLEIEVDSGAAEQNVVNIRKALAELEAQGLRTNSVFSKTGSEFGNLALSLSRAQAANDKASSSSDKAAKGFEDAAKAAASQRKELDALLGSINPLTKELNKLAAQEAALVKARESGQINTATYDAYNKKLQENLNALTGATKAQQAMGESADQARARILAVAQSTVDAAQAQRSMTNTALGLSEAEQGLISATNGVAAAQNKGASSADKASAAIKQATAATEADALAYGKLIDRIDPAVAALKRLDAQQDLLSKSHSLGLLSDADFKKYTSNLDQARAAMAGFNDGMTRTGNTAKQTSAALRMVPAQVTDIFTSLAGGQSVMMVAIQQGGQLKDSFGGIGPAAKALSGYILGLVNPFTVGAAAAAALGAVVVASQEQFNQYQKALVSSGNAAGTTADQLIQLSTSLAGGRNFAEAGEAVLALAQNGRLSGEALSEVARAATELAVGTGRSAADIADQLSNTKANVTALAVEYSDKYGVITQDTYELIRALEDQGDKIGAIKVLSGAVADEMGRRNKEMVDSTRGLAKAWDDVKTSVLGVYNQIKTGLSASPELFKLQHLQGQLDDAKALGDKALISGLTEQVRIAQVAVDLQSKKNEGVAAELNERKTLISAESQWDTDGLKYRTNAKKMEDEITVARRQGLEAGRSQLEIEKRISAIRDEYAKKEPKAKTTAIDLTGFNDADNKLKALTESYQNSFRLLDASEKAGLINADEYALQKGALLEKEKSQVESAYQAEISALEAVSSKASTTSAQRIGIDQKIADSRSKMVDALKKLDTDQEVLSTQTAARNTKDAASLAAFSQSVQESLALSQQGLDNQLAGIGLGQEGRQRLQDDLKIRQDYQKQIEKLDRDYRNLTDPTSGQTDNYNKETQLLKDALDDRLGAQQDYYVKLAAYQADWKNGASAAFEDYIHETKDIAGQTYNLFSDSLHGIEDSFVNAAVTGKLSFKDLADSIIADLARIVAKAYIVTPILAALGIGGDSPTGSSGGTLSSLTGGGSGLGGTLNNIKNVVSVAGSKFGQAISSGWSSGEGVVGGLENAFSSGAGYVKEAITSAFTAGSAAAASTAALTSESIAATISQSSATYASQFSAAGASVSFEAAANASASAATSSLATLSSVLGYIQGVYTIFQSFQSYGLKGAAVTGGLAAAGAYVGSFVGPIGTAVGFAIGATLGALGAGKLFASGEKYPDQSTSATGRYVNGTYTDTGIQQGWQTKAPKYGAAADAQMSSVVQQFSTTLGMLYDTIGNGADVVAYNLLQVRKTSGKYSTTLGSRLDDGSVLEEHQQFNAADAAAALTENYDNVMGTFLAKAIVSSKSLPDYFKAQFTAFASDWDTTADEVIKAIEGVFTRFNGVNDALTLINVHNLQLDQTGMIASDSILNMIGAMADLDTTTATAKEKVDALNTAVGTYYQAFFSADEQFTDLANSLKGAFAGFGLELPDTRSAYRDMVEDIDVTTAAGQAMFATLVGLATNADSYYTEVDKRAQAAADAASQAAQAAADAAQAAAEAAAGAWSNYYDLFATDGDKARDTLERVGQEFGALGLALPASRDGFKAMVAAIDLTTVAGQSLFNSLLGLATDADAAFDIMEASAAAATQAANDAAAAAEASAKAVTDALNLAVTNSFSAVQRAISAQQKAAQAAYEATTASLNDMADTAAEKVSGLTAVGDDLSAALKSLRGDSDEAVKMLRAQAQATLKNALAAARAGGSLVGFAGLSDALDTVGSNNTDLYSSLEDFNRDQGRTAGVIAELEAINGKQLTAAEKLQKSLQDQIDQAKASYDLQSDQFDSQLAFAQSQLDALNGVDTSVKTVTSAIAAMNASVVAALSALPHTGTGSAAANTWENSAALVHTAYKTAFGRDADEGGLKFWTDALSDGTLSYDQLLSELVKAGKANGESIKIPGYAAGGSHGGGIRLVGERGPEIEVTGPSRIYSANKTAAMLSGSASQDAASEVRELRAELRSALFAIAKNTMKAAKNTDLLPQKLEKELFP